MLANQAYEGHVSIHDDVMADELGFQAGPIEGPTHFSQVTPLAHRIFGDAFFESGCISAHYKNMVVEGEQVRAFAEIPEEGSTITRAWAEKSDGSLVLTATLSVGSEDHETEIDAKLAKLRAPEQLVILADCKIGMRQEKDDLVCMQPNQHMGDMYPFSLNDKLAVITENSPWYCDNSPWGGPIIPFEMISVLVQYTSDNSGFPRRGPAVDLFAGQEIKLFKGPLMVGQNYLLEREIIALSESRRTESNWIRTRVKDPNTGDLLAQTILNLATLKSSYARYEADAQVLVKSGLNTPRPQKA